MTEWLDYITCCAGDRHTVTGTLKVRQAVYSPQLDNQRDIYVYLPPAYAAEPARRFPVLYMHDGQNLFDAAISHSGEWGVDETLDQLAAEGIAAIVVGVPNMGAKRPDELSPFHNPPESEGRGTDYMRFIVETVKPLVDGAFRTLPDREHTGIAGSSMGGLISLFGFVRFPAVFGLAGAFSPALWFGQRAIYDVVAQADFSPGRVYMDVGTSEGANMRACTEEALAFSTIYLNDVNRMRDLLVDKGCTPGSDLQYVVAEGAIHNEADWALRLPDALRYLLAE
jgi:predicted alpha/beta superfamily hydrolase